MDEREPFDHLEPTSAAGADPTPEGVSRLLSELADLRLLLSSDLSIAAAAVDAEAFDIASEVLGDEHERLNSLQARILRSVTPAPRPVEQPVPLAAARRRRLLGRLPAGAAPALAAAAVAAAVFGATAVPSLHSSRPSLAADVDHATDSYDAFSRIATSRTGDAADVQAAAAQLHASLQPLIDAAGTDPESAQRALELLQAEQLVLMQSKPAGAMAILQEAHRLVLRLRAAAPAVVPSAATRPITSSPAPTSKAKPATTTSPSPSPTASPKPKPTQSPKSTTSPSPSSSPSSSPPGIIPGL